MSHEVSVTRQNKYGTYSNYRSVGNEKGKSKRLYTNGKNSFPTIKSAVSAAKDRSNRSNYGHGNNTIHESTKERHPTTQRRTKGGE